MQVNSPKYVQADYEEIAANIGEDLRLKVRVTEHGEEEENSCLRVGDEDEHVSDDDEDEEEEFSFACMNPDGSPISADDIFQNGQIRPVFPLFNRDLLFADDGEAARTETSSVLRPPLKKLFVEGRDGQSSSSEEEETDEAEGPVCVWKAKAAVEASPEGCKKSNSTGFSKLWRFRELVQRSNSDGKDAFVFLNSPQKRTVNSKTTIKNSYNNEAEKSRKVIEKRNVVGVKKGKKGGETASSAHERHYVRNRAMKEGDKRKSYLPYRQDLVGFFTNVNGLSKNVHPF